MLRNVPKLPSLAPHVTAEPIPGLFFKSLPFKWIAYPSSATCLSVYTCPLSVRLHVLSRLWVGQCLSWDAPFLTWAIGILGYEPGTWRPGDKSYHFLLNNYRGSALPTCVTCMRWRWAVWCWSRPMDVSRKCNRCSTKGPSYSWRGWGRPYSRATAR